VTDTIEIDDVATRMMEQFVLLEKALDAGNEALARSIINAVRPVLGTDYIVIALQAYMVNQQNPTEETTNLFLDLYNDLVGDAKTEHDALYVAPNLSTEVQDLLLYLGGEVATQGLKSGSPNWYMIPTGVWEKLLRLASAASERHAK
jgi:hypothetical protein